MSPDCPPEPLARPGHPRLPPSLYNISASKPPTDSEDPERFTTTPDPIHTSTSTSSSHAADSSPPPPPNGTPPKKMSSSSGSISRPKAPASPNARSQDITVAAGFETDGTLNQHPATDSNKLPTFRVGVSEDRNRKCRRTMEDAHAFIYDYCGVPGQGYFAVFDGHAGKNSAEWCGAHFHEHLRKHLESAPKDRPVPDTLNETFLSVDRELSSLAEAEHTHSGCTAVVAFLRVEDGSDALPEQPAAAAAVDEPASVDEDAVIDDDAEVDGKKGSRTAKVKSVLGKITGSSSSSATGSEPSALQKTGSGLMGVLRSASGSDGTKAPVTRVSRAKRVLYTANAGDARAVICRRGKAVRLTYDHKGSDQQEAKRITDAGGFVMNNRVNGVLAVTRALGDASVKEYVVGSPYTTETALDDGDEFLIVACDGLWDVAEDQDAVDLVRDIADPQAASEALLKHALESFSTDNLSVLVVRLGPKSA